MTSSINDSIRSEDPSQTVVAAEEQQLLEQLEARAPKTWARFTTMPMLFMMF
jgi:hypothetical protein